MTLELLSVAEEHPKMPKGILYFLASTVKIKKPERAHKIKLTSHDQMNFKETHQFFKLY